MRPGNICYKELKEESLIYKDNVKVKLINQSQSSWQYVAEVTGKIPPDDILIFLCNNFNWGGSVQLVKQDDNTKTYNIKTYKD